MKKRLIALSCAAMLFSGCYGSYALFHKVHKFNGGIGDKWINSLVHFVFIPVYGVSLVADGLLFNAFEFWTGSNPVASGDTYMDKDAEGNTVAAVKNEDGTLSVSIMTVSGEETNLTLQRDEDVIRALDKEGNVVGMYMALLK